MSRAPRAAVRAFREAQEASAAGDQDRATRLLAEVRRLAPDLPHLELHAALVTARAGQPVTALRELAAAGRDDPVARLFQGWCAARAERLPEARRLLEGVLAAQPHNRVAATALAYVRLRQGQVREALGLLQAGPSDNHEILAWAWLELERRAWQRPLPTRTPPAAPARAISRRAARRLFRAGVAAAQGNTQAVVRRRLLAAAEQPRPALLARPLRPLLQWLDRRWPSTPLVAFQAARAAGCDHPELGFHLGAQLSEDGYPAAALPELEAACAILADSPEVWLPQLYRALCLVELQRVDEAAEALAEVARTASTDEPETAGATHEFGQPWWHFLRALVRLARRQEPGAIADLQRALAGDPALFDQRLTTLAERLDQG